jgi:hypothetical protein
VGPPPGADEKDEGRAGEGAGTGETIFLRKERTMKARVLFFFTVSLLTVWTCTVSVHAAADLVVTSISGPTTAIHNQKISVTYTVKNQGTLASGHYQVDLYLSTDKTIDPAAERLLKNVTFSKELEPGQIRRTTTKVLVPVNGLSGKYYYGAVVGSSKKASSKQVSLGRYSLEDDNATVKDHKTGLVWQRVDDGQYRDWEVAKQYCKDLVLGGKTDWRLPSLYELETTIDYSRYDPTIDPLFSCRSDVYWSDTTYVDERDYAWSVYYLNGDVNWYYKTDYYYVRCMRSGP